jgi:hypothetical protein
MRPGREHLVYTLDDCIMRGGHFYAHSTLTMSLYAGIRESLHGRTSTNDVNRSAETVIQRILSLYCSKIISRKGQGEQLASVSEVNLACLCQLHFPLMTTWHH